MKTNRPDPLYIEHYNFKRWEWNIDRSWVEFFEALCKSNGTLPLIVDVKSSRDNRAKFHCYGLIPSEIYWRRLLWNIPLEYHCFCSMTEQCIPSEHIWGEFCPREQWQSFVSNLTLMPRCKTTILLLFFDREWLKQSFTCPIVFCSRHFLLQLSLYWKGTVWQTISYSAEKVVFIMTLDGVSAVNHIHIM